MSDQLFMAAALASGLIIGIVLRALAMIAATARRRP